MEQSSTPDGPRRANTSDPLLDPTQAHVAEANSNGDLGGNASAGHYAQNSNGALMPPDADTAQYATYPDAGYGDDRPNGVRLTSYSSDGKAGSGSGSDEKERPWMANQYSAADPEDSPPHTPLADESQQQAQPATVRPWVPVPLRTWFWVPLVLIMAGGGIGFEVALHFSKHNRGWATKGTVTTTSGFMHYVYTLPPVAISMIFSGLWAWTDVEIRKLQPYVDLAQGDAPPQRSLLLDYTRNHTFYVWTVAAKNRHWLVSLASILVLITFGFQPLAAALFNVQDIFWTNPRTTTTNLAVIGLNQDQNFQDLTSFLTAAGYASANVLYHIGDPEFIHDGFTVAPFVLPNIQNGTAITNTTAVLSQPSCNGPDVPVNMQQIGNGSWTNTATFGDCTFTFQVNRTTQHLFGSNPVGQATSGCAELLAVPQQFRPVLFWYFSYDTTPPTSAVSMCSPAITLWDAEVTVDLASHNVTNVRPLGPLGSNNGTDAAFAQAAGNVTGPPISGRAYNGLFFNLTNPDQFTDARQQAIQLELPASVFQAAAQSGLNEAFENNMFANLSLSVYTTYLALVARTVYFLDVEQPLEIDTMTIHKRLFLSPVATHLLAVAMFVLAIGGTILHLWHRQERQVLTLAAAPGTIASAVSLGAQTSVGTVLSGRQGEEDMYQALRDKRFRIDTRTNKIVMEGEPGYEDAMSPAGRLTFGIPRSISVRAKRLSTGWMPGKRAGVGAPPHGGDVA